MRKEFLHLVRDRADIPLAWAGGTLAQNYLNLGDALSAVMVALVGGKPVTRVPFVSETPRMVAVGTIGQNIRGGEAWFWGTGCSNRQTLDGRIQRYSPDPNGVRHVAATRGPISAALLGGGRIDTDVFCDPVWLLPRFYRPDLPKTHELGVIIHLSELADRSMECRPRPELTALDLPAEMAGDVKLINTVCEISTADMRRKLDEILSCKRIVSTSLHGLVFAESYGIPCLYFPSGGEAGATEETIDFHGGIDLRVADLYLGAGRERLGFYRQPRRRPTDWAAVIAAVDRLWTPATVDADALLDAFPAELNLLEPPESGDIWEHPILAGQTYAHDAKGLRFDDRQASKRRTAEDAKTAAKKTARFAAHRLPALAASPAPSPTPPKRPLRLARDEDGRALLPVAAMDARAHIAAALAGTPAILAPADGDRLTLTHIAADGDGDGVAHIWGAGRADGNGPPTAKTPVVVHAVRGPHSARLLRAAGIDAPEIFGDPICFMPQLVPLDLSAMRFDLGVLLPANATPAALETQVPATLADRVRILRLDLASDPTRLRPALAEMAACRAVLSPWAAGIALAHAYGIAYAPLVEGARRLFSANALTPDGSLGFDKADVLAGLGFASVSAFATPGDKPFDWRSAIDATADLPPPPTPDFAAFFAAFPGPSAAGLSDAAWTEPQTPATPGPLRRWALGR